MALSRLFEGRSSSSFPLSTLSLLQAIDGVMSFGFVPAGSECLKVIDSSELPKGKPLVVDALLATGANLRKVGLTEAEEERDYGCWV